MEFRASASELFVNAKSRLDGRRFRPEKPTKASGVNVISIFNVESDPSLVSGIPFKLDRKAFGARERFVCLDRENKLNFHKLFERINYGILKCSIVKNVRKSAEH